MSEYLFANFDNLPKFFNLNNTFARNAIQTVIANKLVQENFVANSILALRISDQFINFSQKVVRL